MHHPVLITSNQITFSPEILWKGKAMKTLLFCMTAFFLAMSAPCATTGDAMDWTGNPSVIGGRMDMRADDMAVAKTFQQDFNGDGKADILMVDEDRGAAYLLLIDGTRILDQHQLYDGLPDWRVATVGDFNGDGNSDIAFRHDPSGAIYIFLMNGVAVFQQGFLFKAGWDDWFVAGNCDLNGDGKDDLMLRNRMNEALYGFIMNGITAASEGYILAEPFADKWHLVASGDFDGDGRDDLCFRWETRGDIVVALMNGLTIASAGYVYQSQEILIVGSLGDFNGDGKTDLAILNEAGDYWLALMDGFEKIADAQIIQGQPDWELMGARDITGDGKSDLVYKNRHTYHIYGLLMNGLIIQSHGYIYNGSSDWDVYGSPRDFNGDGKADLFCQHMTTSDGGASYDGVDA